MECNYANVRDNIEMEDPTMLLKLLRSLFAPTVEIEVPMVTVVYNVRVVTADGTADLELEKTKETFVPREGDSLHVTTCVKRPDENEIEAVVQDVSYDPVQEVVTVYAETDLDLRDGHKIDCIVESAQEDGWELEEAIEYHGCCKGLCPCDVAGGTEKCDKSECKNGTCTQS